MLTPPVPIPTSSYFLAYHLKSRDASPAPYALRAERARNRQISNGRLYLPLLSFCCDSFSVFTYARHRAHAGATCRCGMNKFFLMPDRTSPPLTRSPSPFRGGKDQRNKLRSLGAHVRGAGTRKASASRVLLDRRITYSAISLGMLRMCVTVCYHVIPGYAPGSLSKMTNRCTRLSLLSF